jgi:tetratricopeptide (TPR) repeat protein
MEEDSRADRVIIAGAGDLEVQASPPYLAALHQLPPPPRDFIGRETEIAEILGAVGKGGATISGSPETGGIGKTALALVVAERLSTQFPDAQIYLDLRGTSPQPLRAADAMRHVVIAYRPDVKPPEDEPELRDLYQSLLQGQRAILLIDNAQDATQVEPLMPPATCFLLVTSLRHFSLAGLSVKNLEALPPPDAYDLLMAIAGGPGAVAANNESQGVPPEEPAHAAPRDGGEHAGPDTRVRNIRAQAGEIARLCGYLPLALRVAAGALAETPGLTPEDYVQRLANTRTALELRSPGKELTLEASLALSYDLLNSELHLQLRFLAVLPETFDGAGAQAVWNVELARAQEALHRLAGYGLVEWNPTNSRYRLHDVVRAFADSLLAARERDLAYRRLAEYYVNIAADADQLLLKGGEGVRRGLEWFDREWSNIQAGQAWAAGRAAQDDHAARLASSYPDAGVYCLDLRQHPCERRVWLEAALGAARRLKDRAAEAVHLGNLGLVYADLGETRRALEYYERRLAIAREMGDRRGEGIVLGNLGLAYADLGETRRAIEFYEQRLAIAREMGDWRGEGIVLGNLGIAYRQLGEARRAIEFYEQHLAIAREMGGRQREGTALSNLGTAYRELGDTRRAIEFYEQHLVIAREMGDQRGEGSALWNLSLALEKLGDRAQALARAEAALKIFEAIGDPNAATLRAQLAPWRMAKSPSGPGNRALSAGGSNV